MAMGAPQAARYPGGDRQHCAALDAAYDHMLTVLRRLWSWISSPVGQALGVLGALLGAWLYAKSRGRADLRAEQAQDRLEELEQVRGIEDEVDRRSPDETRERVRKWARD